MNLKGNRLFRGGLAGAALAIVPGLLLLWPRLGDGLVGLSYDWLFHFRSNVPVEGVTMLYMDQDSEIQLHQSGRQAWSRAVHTRLLDQLKEFHPRAVVFDILFVPSEDEPEADRQLVRAAKAVGNVVVAAKPSPDIVAGEAAQWRLTLPFPALRDAVTWGVVEVADADKNIRKLYQFEDLDMPSMAWRVAERTTSPPCPEPFAPRWINYYGPQGYLRHFSYYEAFETNRIPLNALSNQVVFVGALYDIGFTGGKRTDDFRTPYTAMNGRRSPGVEINAMAYLNIVRGDWLRRLPWWIEAGLVVLCGGVFGFGFALCRPLTATGLGVLGFVLTGGVAMLAAWQTHVFFPWLIVGAVQIPCALGWSVLAQTQRLHREKKVLEQTLALAQAGAPNLPENEPAPARDAPWSPVNIGSSARSSEPARRVEDQVTVLAAAAKGQPLVPDHELLRCIGKGAYGEVWLARDIIGTYHAVKVVYRSKFQDAVPFDREFNGIRRFTPISRSHPGFVHVLHVGRNERGDYLYCVMELGDDEKTGQQINPQTYAPRSLARELHQRGRLPLVECLKLSIQLADALQYLHEQKLIHRDIKPSNIIFVNGAPKFADIGLVTEAATEGRDVTYLGTKGYIAPEGPGSSAADVFSLGKVIYEAGFGLDAGRFPELPTTMVENPETAWLFQLNRILLKACEEDLSRRYKSAAELGAALAELLKRVEAPSKS